MVRVLVPLAVLAVVPAAARGQDWPKPTPAGERARAELLATCARELALLVGRPPTSVADLALLGDAGAFRVALAARRDLPAPALRDALVGWRVSGQFPVAGLPLLDALGVESRDPVARGFAALIGGLWDASRGHSRAAAAGFESGAEFFPEGGRWGLWKPECWSLAGASYTQRGDLDRAQERYERALGLFERSLPPGHPKIAACLSDVGAASHERGDYAAGLAALERSLRMQEALPRPDPRSLVLTLNNLGVACRNLGDYGKAVEYCQRALRIAEAELPPGHPDVIMVLSNLGVAHDSRGDRGMAEEYFGRALRLREATLPPGHPLIGNSLLNMGIAARARGDDGKALEYFERALRVAEDAPVPGRAGVAECLGNIGLVYSDRGDHRRALEYYARELRVLRKAFREGHPRVAEALNNVAAAHYYAGEYDLARAGFEEVLRLREAALPAGHLDIARTLSHLGLVHREAGDRAAARAYFDRALEALRRPGSVGPPAPLDLVSASDLRPDRAAVDAARARADLLAAGLPPRPDPAALRACLRAFDLASELHDRLGETLTREESRLRATAEGAELLALQLPVYRALFARTGNPADLRPALAAIERARARVFLDGLARSHAGLLAGAPPALRDRQRLAEARVRAIDRRTRDVLDRQAHATPGTADPDFPRLLADLDTQRRQAEDDLARLAAEIERVAPAYAALRFPRPCTVEEARSALAADEVALLFAPGPKQSAVLLLDGKPDPADPAGGLRVYELPGTKTFAAGVEALTDPDTLRLAGPSRDLGAELFDLLLGPVKDRLDGKNLVIVPDGVLCHLPFELLVEGDKFLVETRRVRYAPSLTALHLTRKWERARPRPDRPLFAVGDPVFGPPDDRLGAWWAALIARARPGRLGDLAAREGRTRGDADFPRLVHSGGEVRAVAAKLGAGPDSVLAGFDATLGGVRTAAADGRLGRSRFVHLATHGVLGLGDGQPPALVLGRTAGAADTDQLLRLDEVPGLPLNADLVVLSACRTGRGRLHAGEGVTSMARAFLAAGSRGVVCSLWSVDDAQTGRLMAHLYEGLVAGDSAAEALRGAKLKLIADGLPPFYWAPFVLQGE